MNEWFTSDQHFGHTNILKYCNRPFDTVEAMNEHLVDAYNAVVKDDDIVWHMGDFAMSWLAVPKYLRRLRGEKHLILGNHDHAHPGHPKGKKNPLMWIGKYLDAGFTTVGFQERILRVNGSAMLTLQLHHMPYLGTEPGAHGQKHTTWRLHDTGLYLLHGHTHGRWRKKGRMIDVGVDAWDYRPVHFDEVLQLIAQGVDHNE